jgi:hypothetical protein
MDVPVDGIQAILHCELTRIEPIHPSLDWIAPDVRDLHGPPPPLMNIDITMPLDADGLHQVTPKWRRSKPSLSQVSNLG